MCTKFKIKGKTYTLVEEQDVVDPQLIKYRAIVKDRKGNLYTLMHSMTGYHLYDSNNRRFAETSSIQKWES